MRQRQNKRCLEGYSQYQPLFIGAQAAASVNVGKPGEHDWEILVGDILQSIP